MYCKLFIAGLAALLTVPAWAQDKPKESQLVQAARRKLDTKITVEFKDEPRLADALDEIKGEIAGLNFTFETGVSRNQKLVPVTMKDKPVKEVLEAMFKGRGLGFYVVTKAGDRNEGWIRISQNPEQRGDEVPVKEPAKETPKDPPKTDPKPDPKPDPKDPPKIDPTADAEKAAASKLKLGKLLLEDGKTDDAKVTFEEIVKKYPTTKSAAEAKTLLDKLNKK